MEEDDFKAIMAFYGVKSEYIERFWARFGSKMTREDLEFVMKLFDERATKEEKDQLLITDVDYRMSKLEFFNLMKESKFDVKSIHGIWDSFQTYREHVKPREFRSFVLKFLQIINARSSHLK